MGRRSFTTEFKHEAVRLVRERGMTVGQAARERSISDRSPRAERPAARR
jgi:transposase-like protein